MKMKQGSVACYLGMLLVQYIAKSLGNDTKYKIENSPFYGLLTDGSADSVTENEALFVMRFQ